MSSFNNMSNLNATVYCSCINIKIFYLFVFYFLNVCGYYLDNLGDGVNVKTI